MNYDITETGAYIWQHFTNGSSLQTAAKSSSSWRAALGELQLSMNASKQQLLMSSSSSVPKRLGVCFVLSSG